MPPSADHSWAAPSRPCALSIGEAALSGSPGSITVRATGGCWMRRSDAIAVLMRHAIGTSRPSRGTYASTPQGYLHAGWRIVAGGGGGDGDDVLVRQRWLGLLADRADVGL